MMVLGHKICKSGPGPECRLNSGALSVQIGCDPLKTWRSGKNQYRTLNRSLNEINLRSRLRPNTVSNIHYQLKNTFYLARRKNDRQRVKLASFGIVVFRAEQTVWFFNHGRFHCGF